ncbi:dentin matrix acidic phosphoprotein 1-like [Penaeus japonicus]|uniref:dentin matrix acidic phosphoprotein 1-like n=1 Tax=Penaeus japonicus TaxID=27405 RepID=UPI001C70FA43|nr:dentin matrix acidic phosphoprotein 1-like [Penaeus japonicus]
MSESDCLSSMEKKDAENYPFSSDSSSNSMDISDQITIQVFTQGQEGDQFETENGCNKDVGGRWINGKRETKEAQDGETQNGKRDDLDDQGKEVDSGVAWAEEGKVCGVGDEGGNDSCNDDSTGTENTKSEDDNSLNAEQEVLCKNDARADGQLEADVDLEPRVSSDGSQDGVISEDINETLDNIKEDPIPVDSSENSKQAENLATDVEVDGKEETEVQRLSEGVCKDDVAEDKHIVQELSVQSDNAQCKSTKDVTAADTEISIDSNTPVSDMGENTRLSEGTVVDNDVRICKETPGTVNSDQENDSSEPIYDDPESKEDTDTQSTADYTKQTEANSQVQNDDVDMKWESDTNTSEWETGMFVTEVRDHKTGQEEPEPECQSEKEDDSPTFSEENADNILDNPSKDSGGESSRDVGHSTDNLGISSENDKAASERVFDNGEVSDKVETEEHLQNQQNDDQQTLPSHSDAAEEDQLIKSTEGDNRREKVHSEEVDMHAEEPESRREVSSILQNDEQEQRDIEVKDNASEEENTKVHKRTINQKRKSDSVSVSPNKKSMRNMDRVRKKLEEIMEKSKAEEDKAIAELQKMKQEKAEVLQAITAEMEVLKSLLGQGKVQVLKKK